MSTLILQFNKKLLKAFDRLDCTLIIIHIELDIQCFDFLFVDTFLLKWTVFVIVSTESCTDHLLCLAGPSYDRYENHWWGNSSTGCRELSNNSDLLNVGISRQIKQDRASRRNEM